MGRVARDENARCEPSPGEVASPFAVLAGTLLIMAMGVPWYAALMLGSSVALVVGLWILVRDW